MAEPQVQYTKTSDGVNIAYYAIGEGTATLFLMSPASHLEAEWQIPPLRAAFLMAAQNGTFIRFDPRGFGLSDREVNDLSLDAMVSDIEAVVDRLDLDSLAIYAFQFQAVPAVAYAARHPNLVTHLVLASPGVTGEEHTSERLMALRSLVAVDWKLATETATRSAAPYLPEEMIGSFAELLRASIDAEAFLRFWDEALKWNAEEDAKSLQIPTLLIHERSNPNLDIGATRRAAGLIPNARIAFVDESLEGARIALAFLTGEEPEEREEPSASVEPASTAVILFADIVESTALTERMGDAGFRAKSRQLDGALRAIIQHSGGTAIEGKLLGDGVLAVFTSAVQALGAATSFGQAGEIVGLELHLGLHAGDVIREDGNVFGGAVNIAARIAAESAAGEVLISQTVRDLARTSAGVSFEDRGERELKGVGEPVRLYAVKAGD